MKTINEASNMNFDSSAQNYLINQLIGIINNAQTPPKRKVNQKSKKYAKSPDLSGRIVSNKKLKKKVKDIYFPNLPTESAQTDREHNHKYKRELRDIYLFP